MLPEDSGAGAMRRWLPKHHYPPARLRCVLPSCDETQEIGLAFDLHDGSILRLRLSLADAQGLLCCLRDDHRVAANGVQSPMSSGSPSVEGSTLPTQSQ